MLYFDCPTSYGFPVVDTAIAVSGGLMSLAIISFATNPMALEAINVTGARASSTAQISAGATIALVAIPLLLVGSRGRPPSTATRRWEIAATPRPSSRRA